MRVSHNLVRMWFEPILVVKVLAAELTLSPNHTGGWTSRAMLGRHGASAADART